MKKALSVITIVLAFAVSGLAQTKKNIEPADIHFVDQAIRADVSRLTLLMVADESIPIVCDDNFRFCVAGCSANDGACAGACFTELQKCIKSIKPVQEAEVATNVTWAPDASFMSTHPVLQAESLSLRQ